MINEIKLALTSTNRPKNKLPILFIIISLLIYILLLRNYFLSFGSLIVGLLVFIFASTTESPLILASWIALPFVYDIGSNMKYSQQENNSICIGEVIGSLERSFSSTFSRITINSRRYSWRSRNYKYCVNIDNLKNYSIAIIGTSGSGKSHAARLIVQTLKTGYLVFDIHGEYNVHSAIKIDASKVKINPLSLMGESPRQRALEVSYMLKSVFNLGNIQTFELYNMILDAYALKGIYDNDESTWSLEPPNFFDVYSLLQKRKTSASSQQEFNKYESLEPYISFLASEVFASNSITLDEMMSKNVIVDLSRLSTIEVKYIVLETILRGIYYYLFVRGQSKLWKFVIIDEAPFVLSKDTGKDIVAKLVAEGRKFGLGVILISQNSKVLREIISNVSLLYAFNIVEPSELEYISKFLSGSDEDEYKAIYESLQKLNRGFMITKDLYRNSVILVRLNSS